MQPSKRTLSPQVCTCPPKPNGDYESDKQHHGDEPSSRQRDPTGGSAGRRVQDFRCIAPPPKSGSIPPVTLHFPAASPRFDELRPQMAWYDFMYPGFRDSFYQKRCRWHSYVCALVRVALLPSACAHRPRLFRQLRWRLTLSSGTAVPSAASSSAQRLQAQAIVQCASSLRRSARGKAVST